MAAVDYYSGAGAVGTSFIRSVGALQIRNELTRDSTRLLLCMVGMPARGKSFISAKLTSFLRWQGYCARTFNAGQKRRVTPETTPDQVHHHHHKSRMGNARASFFDATNESAKAQREAIAMLTLDEVFAWFDQGGDIALFDATNSTKERRRAVLDRVAEHSGISGDSYHVVFIESLCDDTRVLENNMRTKVRSSPDFKDMDEEAAMEDLRIRISNYEAVYETVEDHEGPYIKLFNFSSKVVANQCYGRMSKTILPFTMAIHVDSRPIYLATLAPQHLEPEFAKYGTDPASSPTAGKSSPTTPRRRAIRKCDETYGRLLAAWWDRERTLFRGGGQPLLVFTSTRSAAVDAARLVENASMRRQKDRVCVSVTSALNPLLLTEDDNQDAFRVSGRRSLDDRGTGGESYRDLILRLESCLLDVEAAVDPVLIITHATPARALRAYFRDIDVVECMGECTSPETVALANGLPTVLEIRQQIGGAWIEKIHDLATAPELSLSPPPSPPPTVA